MTFEQALKRFTEGYYDLGTLVVLIEGVKEMQAENVRLRKELSTLKESVDGRDVEISASYVTGGGDGYKGTELVGVYQSMAELNADLPNLIRELQGRTHWRLEIDFQDKAAETPRYRWDAYLMDAR